VAKRKHSVVAPSRNSIRNGVLEIGNLPTLPFIAHILHEMIEEPGILADDIAQFVSKDPALSANFLRLVNSPFYGFPGRIVSVRHALTLAGPNVVRAAASKISVCITQREPIVGLWEHSLGVALASRLLAERFEVTGADEVMVAGLLHDIGKIALRTLFEEEADEVYRVAAERDVSALQAEREILDVDHAEIGLWMADRWNFPATLRDPIAYHHGPARSEDRPVKTAIVHFADILVRSLDFGYPGDAPAVELQEDAWNILGLSVENLPEIVDEVDNELSVNETALYRST
jgi:putative nucleotidyltransferase with HDIG domain